MNVLNVNTFFKNDIERAEYLQKILISHSTGSKMDNNAYKELRKYFLSNNKVPNFVRQKRNLDQFWSFIKYKFDSYHERRDYIYNEFSELLNSLENDDINISDENISKELIINSNNIHNQWEKALNRKKDDPEGAITISRTLLESVLKYLLDEMDIEYTKNSNFSELYRKVSVKLNLSPDNHNEKIFKQILGGCSGIINGLALLRNNLGDSHGGKKIQPLERHSELAVNLSGAMSIFLFKTFNKR